ncbi:MAG: hypothetical protein FJW39_35010 [Acidobacteria bacterium]|nr:hypothetical protein [Acidobacteriota bacterium]
MGATWLGKGRGDQTTDEAKFHETRRRARFAVVIGETGRVFEIAAVDSRHLLVPADYYVDANTANEGLVAAYRSC